MIIVENKFKIGEYVKYEQFVIETQKFIIKSGVISRIKYVEGLDMFPNISYGILTKEDYEYYIECGNMCKLDWVDEEHILSKFG